jgi:hypothetical protein
MKLKSGEWLLLLFNLAYIIGFTIYYISIKNFEFLVYIAVLVVLFLLVAGTLRKTRFSPLLLWGLSLWGLLHMMGGGVRIDGVVLYGLTLIPIWETADFVILRFDQFVHAYLYFLMVFVIYHLIKNHVKPSLNSWVFYILILAASVGIGGGNEIVEFSTVLFFENTGVGGYFNTAWDLVFNTLGALIGVLILASRGRK